MPCAARASSSLSSSSSSRPSVPFSAAMGSSSPRGSSSEEDEPSPSSFVRPPSEPPKSPRRPRRTSVPSRRPSRRTRRLMMTPTTPLGGRYTPPTQAGPAPYPHQLHYQTFQDIPAPYADGQTDSEDGDDGLAVWARVIQIVFAAFAMIGLGWILARLLLLGSGL